MDIAILKREIIDNSPIITADEMEGYMNLFSTDELTTLANELREHYFGNDFDTCSIINARSGVCSEDCKWCSQSRFYHTNIETYPLITEEEAVEAAEANASRGVRRFSLVTSGRKVNLKEMDKVSKIYNRLQKDVDIELCASMGLLNKEEMQRLWDCGVRRYHCNIESSPKFFPTLCSTHTMEEKIETIHHAQKLGMAICSGGIIGMGETMRDRIEMAYFLRTENIDSIPINVLNPIKGTPLANSKPLSTDELRRSYAMFRIMNPKARIRFAGGRKQFLDVQEQIIRGGVDSAIVGDMLTTVGSAVSEDMELFKSMGYRL